MADRKSSISGVKTLREIGEFWDTHDFTDFDMDTADVEMKFSSAIVSALALELEVGSCRN